MQRTGSGERWQRLVLLLWLLHGGNLTNFHNFTTFNLLKKTHYWCKSRDGHSLKKQKVLTFFSIAKLPHVGLFGQINHLLLQFYNWQVEDSYLHSLRSTYILTSLFIYFFDCDKWHLHLDKKKLNKMLKVGQQYLTCTHLGQRSGKHSLPFFKSTALSPAWHLCKVNDH